MTDEELVGRIEAMQGSTGPEALRKFAELVERAEETKDAQALVCAAELLGEFAKAFRAHVDELVGPVPPEDEQN